jgi:threonine/homoserine efflux transporter RhtA
LILSSKSQLVHADPRGYALALLGGFFFGCIPIFEEKTSPLKATDSLLMQSGFAVVCLLPFNASVLSHLDFQSLRATLILGSVFTLLPFVLWWKATRLVPKLSPFVSYLDPITATCIGFIVFSEHLSFLETVSILCMAVGAVIHIFHANASHLSTEAQESLPEASCTI